MSENLDLVRSMTDWERAAAERVAEKRG